MTEQPPPSRQPRLIEIFSVATPRATSPPQPKLPTLPQLKPQQPQKTTASIQLRPRLTDTHAIDEQSVLDRPLVKPQPAVRLCGSCAHWDSETAWKVDDVTIADSPQATHRICNHPGIGRFLSTEEDDVVATSPYFGCNLFAKRG